MNRFFLCFLLILPAFSIPSFAERSRVVVFSPDMENVSQSEFAWLPGAVRDEMESELRIFTDFLIVDNANERKIKEIQRNSLEMSFSDETSIEIGRLTSASYAVFSTIRRTQGGFTLSSSFTDLTTGEKRASVVSSQKKSGEELCMNGQNAVSEVVLKLCQQLSIELDANQRYILQHGDSDLSISEQILLSNREKENYRSLLENYDAEIAVLSLSTEISSVERKARLEAEKAVAEEKLKAASQKTERLLAEQRQKDRDAMEDARRGEIQKARRDQIALEAAEKASQVRSKKVASESVIGQIRIIESKKRTLLEIRSSVSERAQEIKDGAREEFKRKKAEIEGREYRLGERDRNGNPLPAAMNMRGQEIDFEMRQIYSRADAEIASLKSATQSQEKSLVQAIESDSRILGKKRSVSTLDDELELSVGAYDGAGKTWPLYLYLYSDGFLITQETVELPYTVLTGEKLPSPGSSAEYERYLDNVDLYSSLFSRGDPILFCEMDYFVEAAEADRPSSYTFTFSQIRVRSLLSGKTISVQDPLNPSRVFTSSPVFDIRSAQQIEQANDRASRSARREERRNERVSAFEQRSGGGGAGGLRVGAGTDPDSGGWSVEVDWRLAATPYFFFYLQFGGIPAFDEFEKVTDYPMYPEGLFGMGVNKRLSGSGLPLNLYAVGAGGITGFGCRTGFVDDLDDTRLTYETAATYGVVRGAFGVDVPLTERFAIFGQMNVDYIHDMGTRKTFVFGIALTKPRVHGEDD